MKKECVLKTVQYAYTMDGRVVRISEITENGNKYKGFDIEEKEDPEVELGREEIYGVAYRIGNAV